MSERWSGPPPLLIAATVLGLVLSPFVSSGGASAEDRPPETGRASLSSAPLPSPSPTPSVPSPPADEPSSEPSPAPTAPAVKPHTVGVVSLNAYRKLTIAEAREDADALTDRRGVDIIGWQEAKANAPVFASLRSRGWDTKQFGLSASELAISWRRDRFTLVSSLQRRVARGVDRTAGNFPFPDTYLVRVTLRDKATGALVSVLNTHLPHAVEDPADLGDWTPTQNAVKARVALAKIAPLWTTSPGRWVIGTGDYNFDARADARARPQGGISRVFAGKAVSSYSRLGPRNVLPTHPYSGRYLDYVHASADDVADGRVKFLAQRSINDLNSDHRALLVWLSLR